MGAVTLPKPQEGLTASAFVGLKASLYMRSLIVLPEREAMDGAPEDEGAPGDRALMGAL